VHRSLVPTCGGMFRAPRALPLNVAREMLLTGDPIDAERAERLGFANRVVA
jgi:enoyl-CoA hydratase